MTLGTTGVSGASCSGDTYLVVQGPGGITYTADDASGSQCSYTSFVTPQIGSWSITEGCFSSTGACSGTVAYTVTPPPAMLLGQIPVSYFNNYQGMNVPNQPYTLQFSSGKVYNVGTQYFIGNMASATETLNTFAIPVTGGAGPCPNGAMRSGTLTVTCSASTTSFSVNENPMCTYAMVYTTTQQCPPGTVFPSPPPSPPPSPSPPPPPSPSPPPPSPPGIAYLLGQIPVSYFNNYQGMNVPNQPYTLQFSSGKVYNVGTQYFIGNMASATETLNTFAIPVTGGAGPCPNGAMRSGTLTVTCSASTTSFSVNENPMCTYAMVYTTTQQCPPGTVFPSPPPSPPPSPSPPPPPSPSPPPPPSPSPPPPTVYTTQHVRDNGASQHFAGRAIAPVVHHVLNDGATTSSTETTANGLVSVFESTSTTDALQQGSGNGHVIDQSTTTDTTSTGHVVTHVQHFTHTSTTDLTDNDLPPVPAATMLCNGGSFSVADSAKNLCLHVKGAATAGGFTVASVNRPVITMRCTADSPNQQFEWLRGASSGQLRHVASGLLLSVSLGTDAAIRDGSLVTVLPDAGGAATQSWIWNDPTSAGTLSSVADPNFEITDAVVNAGANVGLPVHMWHLAASLPSGSPNAAWEASCSA